MKKTMNIIRYTLIVVLVVLLLTSIGIKLFGNMALRSGIENSASSALKVGVTLDDVSLSLLGGNLRLSGLAIDNPQGYEYERLLELKTGNVAVAIRSLLGDTVHIEDIRLDGLNLVIEQKGLTNNLQEILNALDKSEADTETDAGSEPSGKKLQIDNLEISNVTVNVKLLPVPGKSDTVTLTLSPIKMTDLGSDSKMDIAVLTSKILVAIAEGIAKQGSDILPDEMINKMKSTLEESLKVGESLIEIGKKDGKDAAKEAEKIIKGFTESLK